MSKLKQKLIDSINNTVDELQCLDANKIADGILHDISKLNDKFSKLDMAEQQFLGFHYGKWNHSDVTGLIIAMGLTINEWKILKSDYELSYLDDDTLDDIENFFISANENSQKTNIPD